MACSNNSSPFVQFQPIESLLLPGLLQLRHVLPSTGSVRHDLTRLPLTNPPPSPRPQLWIRIVRLWLFIDAIVHPTIPSTSSTLLTRPVIRLLRYAQYAGNRCDQCDLQPSTQLRSKLGRLRAGARWVRYRGQILPHERSRASVLELPTARRTAHPAGHEHTLRQCVRHAESSRRDQNKGRILFERLHVRHVGARAGVGQFVSAKQQQHHRGGYAAKYVSNFARPFPHLIHTASFPFQKNAAPSWSPRRAASCARMVSCAPSESRAYSSPRGRCSSWRDASGSSATCPHRSVRRLRAS